MRNRHRLDEVMLKARLDRGLDLLDAPHQGLDDAARGRIEQRDARAGAGGIARRAHLRQIAVGKHAEDRRVLDVDVAAEGAGEADAIDVIDAEPLHEQRDAGVQRRLRELNRAHVVLRDLHLDRVAPRCSR